MNLFSFSRLFAKVGQRLEERKAKRSRRRAAPPLTLELLEDRTLLSGTPAAVVTNPNAAFAAGFDPQVVVDPVNSQFLVEVDTTGSALAGQVSTNGGQTWTPFTISSPVGDPTTFDSTIGFKEDAYPDVTSPSVAFDRNGNFYVVSNQYNAAALTQAESAGDLASGTPIAGASGAIVFDSFSLSVNGSGVATVTESANSNKVLYQWYGQDPAYNPTVAVDANLPASTTGGPSFTDPVTSATQTDTMAVSINPMTGAVVAPGTSGAVPKGIYVGWNTNFTEPNGTSPATVSRIMIAASGDGGANFTTNQYADTGVEDTWTLNTSPNASDPIGTTTLTINSGGSANPSNGSVVTFAGTGEQVTVLSTNGDTWTIASPGLAFVEPNGAEIDFVVASSQDVGSSPQILFTQGTASTDPNTVAGGQMNIVSTDDAGDALIQQSQPDGGVVGNDVAASATFTSTYNTTSFQNQNNSLPAQSAGGILDASPGGSTEMFTLNTSPNSSDAPGTTVITVNNPDNDSNPANGTVVTFTSTGEQVTIQSTSGDMWALTGTGLADTEFNNAQITFATGSGTSTPNTTSFTDTVNFPTGTDFTKIDDLEVTLDIVDPHMNQLSIVLIPPTGSSLHAITLLANSTNSANQASGLAGLPNLANLGVLTDVVGSTTYVNNVGTVFDDAAPRSLSDPSATTPWIGYFQSSGTVTVQVTAGSFAQGTTADGFLSDVDGMSTAASDTNVNGTWTLEVTDYVNDGETNPTTQVTGVLTGFSMHFSGLISTTGFGAGADAATIRLPNNASHASGDPSYTEHGATREVGLGALPGSPSNFYSTNASSTGTTSGGTPGTGPGIVAAIDNTLGSFSPYQGRLYIAYVSGGGTTTNIELVHSDKDGAAGSWSTAVQVNDDTVADNFSEGDRPEFMPSIAVDPITGTVVIDYYDGRYDASELRMANSISYSVDGGADFSTSVTMNQETTATDAITGDTVDVAPIPGNQGQAGALGFGDRQGLVVYDGDVTPFFSSNLNSAGVEVMTADVTVPSGPVGTSGDMGPVVSDFTYQPTVYTGSTYTGTGTTYSPITYNNVFATSANSPYPVGTRGLSSFVVTFDSPVLISSFTTSQIQVQYESPTGAKTTVAVQTIKALDALTSFGPEMVGLGVLATQFLITLVAPQFAVGTYSYAVGLNTAVSDGALISDDIRSVPTGIAKDNAGPAGTATVSGTSGTAILLGTYMNQNAGALTDVTQVAGVNTTTPITSTASVSIPNGGASTPSTITVSDPYQQVRQDQDDPIEVRVDIATSSTVSLTLTLTSPLGTVVSLGTQSFAPTAGVATVIFADFNPTGSSRVHKPTTPLGALLNQTVNGNWKLTITNSSGQSVTLNDWSLLLPLTTNVFAVPTPVLGTAFQAPYNTTTQPLIIPGPHVVSTAVVSAGTSNTTTTYTTTNVVVQGDQQNLSKQNNINISGNLDNIALSLAAGASTTTDQLLLPITDAFQIQQDATDQIEATVNLSGLSTSEDLEIQLVAQDGNTVTLESSYTPTSNGAATLVFDDFAPTGTIAPSTPLAALVGDNTAGDWQLVITNKGMSTATLTVANWSLTLPHTTSDNEALNSTATGLLVTFDRDMMTSGANTLTAAAVLQMIGPLGPITGTFTIISDPTGTPAALKNRVFEIVFPTAQSLNGTYTLSIAPSVEDTNGNAVDTNLNAGLDVLEGTNSTSTVVVNTNYPNSQPVTLPPSTTVTSTIAISDAFTIAQPTETWTLAGMITAGSSQLSVDANGPTPPPGQFTVIIDNEQLTIAANTTGTTWTIVHRGVDGTTPASHNPGADVIYTGNQIQLQLDITPASMSSTLQASDLSAQLISPTGTVIQLFNNVGEGDGGTQEFNFTTFDDFATTPIQNATPPFSSTYNPQQPLSALDGQSTAGTWQLVITNNGGASASNNFTPTATDIGTLDSWSLTFPHVTPDTGLGQGVGSGDADQISASFRIFNENPTSALSTEQFTAVGPAADNSSANTGPVNAIAVDPSDPSGNTVYVASASGGLWKTTDFLTTNPSGPIYVPLINLGPTGSLNISSIAVFGRNNDPDQSVIYAMTGNPNNVTIPGNIGASNDNAAGIGLLRSEDGGQTWQVLDSTTNVYTSSNGGTATLGQSNTNGNPLPEMDPTATPTAPRDYLFVGLVGYQVTVDPTPLNGQIVVYAAFSNGSAITTGAANSNGGLYRSEDGGNTWTLIQSGNATSVTLAAGSGDAFNDSNRNLEDLYAGFQGTGVLFTSQATSVGTGGLTQFNNQPQYPGRFVATLNNGFVDTTNTPIGTTTSGNPNGANGRIVLATPALTSSPEENLFYQGWVYAAVANAAGTALQGLYVSKDYSGTWTQIQLPEDVTQPGLFTEVFGTNNTSRGDINPLIDNPTNGAINLTLAVDPTDPEIVYLGGGGSNLLRIDLTNLSDPYAMVGYNNIAPGASGASSVETSTTGPASVSAPYEEVDTNNNSIEVGPSGTTNYYNLYHNAQNPFLSSGTAATPYLVGVSNFNNQGTGALMGEIGSLTNNQGVSILSGTIDLRALVAIVDPLTGETRLLVGDDMGVYTGTDKSVTAIQSNVGAAVEVTGSRNGNLQLADMADSAAQPSSDAAALAGALLYGDSQFDNGFPQSTSNVLDTGNLNWTGISPGVYSELNNLPVIPFSGDGESFATDQTGTGQVFQDRWGSTIAINQYPDNGANFFLETPPNGTPQSFTSGISNLSDQGSEFPAQGGSRFAVNPVNADDLLISSQTGKIYLSTNEGNQWLPTNFSGGVYANTLAFGASDSTFSFRDTDSGFLYAGTTNGNIFVSLTGGSTWFQTTGLAGAGAIEQIVTDPTQGSYDAFAVTANGVYYLKTIAFNSSTGAVTSAVWTNITGNLFSQTRPLFNNTNNQYPTLFAGGLTSLAVDWRFAVPTSNTTYAADTWTLATALAAPTMGAPATTLTINSGGPTPPATPFFITIGSEVLQVTNTDVGGNPDMWTVVRAQNGTTAVMHAMNASVTTNGTAPVLYVGGDGGVFRSQDGGTTWTNFPNVTDTWVLASALAAPTPSAPATTLTVEAGGPTPPTTPFTITIGTEELEVTATAGNVWTVLRAQDNTTAAMHAANASVTNNGDNAVQQGGLLPDMQITSLQLLNGDINTSTGLPETTTTGGFNMLVASTYGQGDFAIHLDNSAVLNDVVPQISLAGPQVVSVVPTTTNGGTTLTGITITFNNPVDAQTLLAANIQVRDPNGVLLAVQSVKAVTGSTTQYTVIFQHSDSTSGLYNVSISGATDEAGDLMTPYSGSLVIPFNLPQAVFNFTVPSPGAGIYVYAPETGFQQINTTTASAEAINASGDVVATLTTGGVSFYTESTGVWQQLATGNATLLAIDAAGDVTGYFPNGYAAGKPAGVYEYTSANGAFKPVTMPPQAVSASLLVVDGAGDLFAEFPSSANPGITNPGVYEAPAGSFDFSKYVSSGQATALAVNTSGEAIGEFPNVPNPGVYEAATPGAGFTDYVGSVKATVLAIDSNGNAFAEFPNVPAPQSPGVYEAAAGPSGNFSDFISSGNASLLATDPSGDVFGEFPGLGVYEKTASGPNSLNFSMQLTLPNSVLPPTLVTEDGLGDEFVVLPNNGGVWRYSVATGWQLVSSGTATLLVADKNGDAYGEFPNVQFPGVYEAAAGGSFTDYISSGQATLLAIDGAGDAFGEFPYVQKPGVYRAALGQSFAPDTQISSGQATQLVVNANGTAFAEFPNGSPSGVYEAPLGESFTLQNYVSSGYATLLAVDPAGDAVGEFPNPGSNGVFEALAGGSFTHQLPTSPSPNASLLAMDSSGNVLAALVGQNGVFGYQGSGSSWQPLTSINATALMNDEFGDVFVDLAGTGYYRFTFGNGFVLMPGTEGNANVLA